MYCTGQQTFTSHFTLWMKTCCNTFYFQSMCFTCHLLAELSLSPEVVVLVTAAGQCLPATRRQWTVDTRARTHPLRYRWPSHYELYMMAAIMLCEHISDLFYNLIIIDQSIIFTILPVSTSLEELGHVAFNDWLPTEQNGAWDGSGGSVVSGSNMCMCILPIIGNTVLCGQSPNFQQQQQLVKGLSIRDWLL